MYPARYHYLTLLILLLAFASLQLEAAEPAEQRAKIEVGADQSSRYLPLLKGKKVALTTNHTALLSDGTTHLLDHLLAHQVDVVRLFTPEHGLRGTADAGARVKSGQDEKTGIPIISLYGRKKKPTPKDLQGIDIMIFDMQDVGTRFYTYISTLTYLMESCAEVGLPLLILDRPNPHDYIDGPIARNKRFQSFISLLPIPVLHGLTLGEAALMINGEGWLTPSGRAGESSKETKAPHCDLTVITLKGWQHGDPYTPPTPPSPNLRSDLAIHYYPTLCYFEATSWSVGRGTKHPFEQVGYPDTRLGKHTFLPRSQVGASKPKHLGRKCYGPDLTEYKWGKGIQLHFLLQMAERSKALGIPFVTRQETFNLLAGTDLLLQQINAGYTATQIRLSWQKDLQAYIQLRHKYLLYPDPSTY